MSRNLFTEKKNKSSQLDQQKLNKWFETNNFYPVEFENGKFRIAVNSMGSYIYHSLLENPGYTTYIKEGFGGSLLVFEIELSESELNCQCYCPMMIFGFKRVELAFKEKTMWITKYRKEGYNYLEKFKEFISKTV